MCCVQECVQDEQSARGQLHALYMPLRALFELGGHACTRYNLRTHARYLGDHITNPCMHGPHILHCHCTWSYTRKPCIDPEVFKQAPRSVVSVDRYMAIEFCTFSAGMHSVVDRATAAVWMCLQSIIME